MTIELINNNYNKLVEIVNASIKEVKEEKNITIKTKIKESVISQINEIIHLLVKECDDITEDINIEHGSDGYLDCIIENCNNKENPFKNALLELEVI